MMKKKKVYPEGIFNAGNGIYVYTMCRQQKC